MSQPFRLGDRVTWTSQSAGVTRTKVGHVAEVVHAGERPSRPRKGWGAARDHESYVVEAVPVGIRHQKKARAGAAYWPLVAGLNHVGEADAVRREEASC